MGVDEEEDSGVRGEYWFDAPALDRAWWQTRDRRVVLIMGGRRDEGTGLTCGSVRLSHSQDTQAHLTAYGYRPIKRGHWERFVSVFVPHEGRDQPSAIVSKVEINDEAGRDLEVKVFGLSVFFHRDGTWKVQRSE